MNDPLIRLPKNEVYNDPIHDESYLSWITTQAERISEYANVIEQLKEEGVRRAISPFKINECAAKLTEFYSKNVAFILIYEEMAEQWGKEAKEIYNAMYLDLKSQVADHSSGRGIKYKKKEATEKEIIMEMQTHQGYAGYIEKLRKAEEYEKKAKAQDRYMKGLGKLDSILSLLQRSINTEMKYLYLE
jgi:hypothetical protein